MIQASNETRIVVEAIKTWMKKHGGEDVPISSELAKAMDITINPTSYTIMKKMAFRELEREGFVLKYNDKRTVAAIDNFNPPADVAEKTAAKICGLEGEQEPAKEQTPTEVAERIVQNFKEKLDKIAPEDLEEPEQKKQKPPLLLFVNKPCIPASGCEGLGIILSAISQMPDAEKVKLSVQIQVKELGAGK
jgi:hypothetical protein